MDVVELSRLQFAVTSIYHFFFVPVTIGLAFLVAVLHTKWYRSGREEHLRLTKFFGTLLLINVAIGVVTGLVQEFHFGMNWSQYSRFVGDVFGAPLAMEGLAAFFLESTFLGLWIFGWKVLPRKLHLATIWIVAFATALSAMFIIAANSWMQNPVGYALNPQTGRAELNDIAAVFTNPIFIWSYIHVLLAALVTAAVIMLGISAWHIGANPGDTLFHTSAKVSLVVLIPASVLIMGVGSQLGVMEAQYQPMKIAAAEAQWDTCQPCSFSAFQIGGGNNDPNPTKIIQIPHLLSILATNDPNGQVVGMNQLQAQYEAQYGPGNYIPNVFVQYWSMRLMAYTGTLIAVFAIIGGLLWWRRRLFSDHWPGRWFLRLAPFAIITPFVMNTAGWMLAENGRQPWIVQGLMKTQDAVSTNLTTTEIWISLSIFIALFAGLAAVDLYLMFKYARRGLDLEHAGDGPTGLAEDGDDRVPALTY